MAKGGGSETSQNQSVSQSTTVSVTNVIENPGLSSLEKLKLVADIFQTLDTNNAQKKENPVNVLVSPQLATNNLPYFIFGAVALIAVFMLRGK